MNAELSENVRQSRINASRRWGWELWFAAAVAVTALLAGCGTVPVRVNPPPPSVPPVPCYMISPNGGCVTSEPGPEAHHVNGRARVVGHHKSVYIGFSKNF